MAAVPMTGIMPAERRRGVLTAGCIVVDVDKTLDHYPPTARLAVIEREGARATARTPSRGRRVSHMALTAASTLVKVAFASPKSSLVFAS